MYHGEKQMKVVPPAGLPGCTSGATVSPSEFQANYSAQVDFCAFFQGGAAGEVIRVSQGSRIDDIFAEGPPGYVLY